MSIIMLCRKMLTRSAFFSPLFICLALLAPPVSAPAHADEDLGRFKEWQAHTYQEDGGTVCNMWSRPISHEEEGRPRGDIYAFVTHRPNDDGRRDEVSLEMGYPVDPKKPVTVKIGSKSWSFFVLDSSAFAHSSDDADIVKSMRAGSRMVVEGVSARGTKTKDTYSLSGFTKAHGAINKGCGF